MTQMRDLGRAGHRPARMRSGAGRGFSRGPRSQRPRSATAFLLHLRYLRVHLRPMAFEPLLIQRSNPAVAGGYQRTGVFLIRSVTDQKIIEKSQNRLPARRMAAGIVSTQARARLRTVAICRPEPLAAIVPATPDDKTCVVETGKP